MVPEWSTTTIDEIKAPVSYSIAMGPFGSDIKTNNFVPSGVPVIRGINLSPGRFNNRDFVFLAEEKADELLSANAFPGDIVFTHRGTLGQVGIIPRNALYQRYVVSQSQMKLNCDPQKAYPLFVLYYFRSSFGQYALLANTSTTGVPAISRPLTSLKSIRIPLPPLPEQRAIAHILGTLDDKIELNQQMNRNLEAIAQAIFKSWFVDFDPVRVKMEGRQPPGTDTATSALFPDSFEDSQVGKIPKGWRVLTIGDACEFAYGKALKENARRPGIVPVYGSNGQIGWHDEALVKGPGVVIGRKGNPGVVTWTSTDFFSIDTTFYVVPKTEIRSMHYFFYALYSLNLASLGADSAVPGLNRHMAYITKLLAPPTEVLNAFQLVAGFTNRVDLSGSL